MRPFKDVLKELRVKHGTQTKVAEDIGISSQLLGQYEAGRQMPKIEFFDKWQEVYNEDIRAIQKETNVSRETKNLTHIQKPTENKGNPLRDDDPLLVYKNLIEGVSEYTLVPKQMIGKTEEAQKETIRAKNALIEHLKKEIAQLYRSQTATKKAK